MLLNVRHPAHLLVQLPVNIVKMHNDGVQDVVFVQWSRPGRSPFLTCFPVLSARSDRPGGATFSAWSTYPCRAGFASRSHTTVTSSPIAVRHARKGEPQAV